MTIQHFRFTNFAAMAQGAIDLATKSIDLDGKFFAEAGIYTDNHGLTHRPQVTLVHTEGNLQLILRFNAFASEPNIDFMSRRQRVEARNAADWYADQIQSCLNALYENQRGWAVAG